MVRFTETSARWLCFGVCVLLIALTFLMHNTLGPWVNLAIPAAGWLFLRAVI
ncbi:hypothetical protein SPH9361_00493 [Sphingobium sp. CECT 9361]|nr:hypothetical protein SPH9361_00493 [Sphingobium sp. CECT 9361]